jgi:hypothetical protein
MRSLFIIHPLNSSSGFQSSTVKFDSRVWRVTLSAKGAAQAILSIVSIVRRVMPNHPPPLQMSVF